MDSQEVIDLFARSTPLPTRGPMPESPAIVLPFRKQVNLRDQDEACCGCYFMSWGKQLRRICCNPEHPGPIGEKAFCLDESDKPRSFVPFDTGSSQRLSHEEMVAQNYI